MTEENLNPEQEAEAKLDLEGQETVSVEDFKNLQKGVEKLASAINSQKPSKGKEAESKDEAKPVVQAMSSVVRKLYLEQTPEFSEVEDDVKAEALALGQDPIDYYESKKGWQLEAKARAKAREEKEQAKRSIEGTSGKVVGNEVIDFSQIKPEQIKGLSKDQMAKYREYLKRGSDSPIIRRT